MPEKKGIQTKNLLKYIEIEKDETAESFRRIIDEKPSIDDSTTTEPLTESTKPFNLFEHRRNCRKKYINCEVTVAFFIIMCLVLTLFGTSFTVGFISGATGSVFPFNLFGNAFMTSTKICY